MVKLIDINNLHLMCGFDHISGYISKYIFTILIKSNKRYYYHFIRNKLKYNNIYNNYELTINKLINILSIDYDKVNKNDI